MLTETVKKYDTGYTQVLNKVLYDNNLSLRAKGLYAYLFSKSDGWQFHISVMEKELKESRGQIYAAINELIDLGYIIRYQSNVNGVFGGMIYEFVDVNNRDEKTPCTVQSVHGSTPSHNNIYNNTNTDNKDNIYNNNIFVNLPQIDDKILQNWNELAKKYSLSEIRSLTTSRKKKFLSRLKDQKMTEEQFFNEIAIALEDSPFLRGKKWHEIIGHPNDSYWENAEWRADFDFFLQPSSLQKAIEGKYADPTIRKMRLRNQH